MTEEKITQKFRNVDETKKLLIKEIKQNKLISKMHKKFFKILKYAEELLI